MYCIANICYVCFEKKNKPIRNINSSLSANKDIIHIIGYLPFDLAWLKTDRIILICEACCLRLRETYQFQEMCLRNSALLQGYKGKLRSTSISNTESEAELTVRLDLNNDDNDMNKVKCEIKLENEEIYRDECGRINEETEEVYVNYEDSFVKDEDIWKREDADDKEAQSMDNNSIEGTDNEWNSKIVCVNSTVHITNADSLSSGFTCTQEYATNKTELNAAAKKSHTCAILSKSFSRKINLDAHRRGHMGETPFKCLICEKYFSRRWNFGGSYADTYRRQTV